MKKQIGFFAVLLALFSVSASAETFLENIFVLKMEYGKDLGTKRFEMAQGVAAEVNMAELKIEFLAGSGGCTEDSDFRVDSYLNLTEAHLAIVRTRRDTCKALVPPQKITLVVPAPKYDTVDSIKVLNGTDYSLTRSSTSP